MTPNKLTPEEKQMPVIRLPLRIAVFAWTWLFVMLLTVSAMTQQGNSDAAIITFCGTVLPAVAGLLIYSNYRICFDKDRIIYRDIFRRIYRCRYEDIYAISDNGKFMRLETEDKSIRIPTNTKNSYWLLELAKKKQVEFDPSFLPQKNNEEVTLRFPVALPVIFAFLFIPLIFMLHAFPQVDKSLYIIDPICIIAEIYCIIYTSATKIHYNNTSFHIRTLFCKERKLLWENLTYYKKDEHGMIHIYFGKDVVSVSSLFSQKDFKKLSRKLVTVMDQNMAKMTGEEDQIAFLKAQDRAEYQSRAHTLYRKNIANNITFFYYASTIISVTAISCAITLLNNKPYIFILSAILFCLCVAITFIIILAIRSIETKPRWIKNIIFHLFTPSIEYCEKVDPKEQERIFQKHPYYRNIIYGKIEKPYVFQNRCVPIDSNSLTFSDKSRKENNTTPDEAESHEYQGENPPQEQTVINKDYDDAMLRLEKLAEEELKKNEKKIDSRRKFFKALDKIMIILGILYAIFYYFFL